MNKDTIIKVDNISKSFKIPHEKINTIRERVIGFRRKTEYESYKVLDNLSFEIRRGEFFSIIGRNGSGKSTLLKILAGIYSTDKGSIIVDGEVSPFLELGVGFNPELSGKDNIFLNGTILGLSKFELDREYRKIVDFSELSQFIDLKVKNYSSGMQVRLAFSVAMHANKDILLMDEVLAVGDANFQLKCFKVFEEFIEEGKTIIFVSHDPGAVQKYSNRVLYLEKGNVGYIGSANEALSRYMYSEVIQSPGSKSTSSEADKPAEGMVEPGDSEERDHTEINKKTVEIVGAEILDENGAGLHEVVHGQTFQIRIWCNLAEELSNLIFGIIIYDQKKKAIFTTNTFSENIKTGKIGTGLLKITYRITNYLSAGNYLVSATVSDKTQRIYYDWKDGILAFRVTNINRLLTYGGVDLPHKIEVNKE
jgi:ABC-type polysaccharide/polyol phosphate transport system ATPase subunit